MGRERRRSNSLGGAFVQVACNQSFSRGHEPGETTTAKKDKDGKAIKRGDSFSLPEAVAGKVREVLDRQQAE
jgi:hypothetical protein